MKGNGPVLDVSILVMLSGLCQTHQLGSRMPSAYFAD